MKRIVLCLSLIVCSSFGGTLEVASNTHNLNMKSNIEMIYMLEDAIRSLSTLYKERCASWDDMRANGFANSEDTRIKNSIEALCKAMELLTKKVQAQANTIA